MRCVCHIWPPNKLAVETSQSVDLSWTLSNYAPSIYLHSRVEPTPAPSLSISHNACSVNCLFKPVNPSLVITVKFSVSDSCSKNCKKRQRDTIPVAFLCCTHLLFGGIQSVDWELSVSKLHSPNRSGSYTIGLHQMDMWPLQNVYYRQGTGPDVTSQC